MNRYFLVIVLLLLIIPQNVFAAPVDITGSGTPEDPYVIYTANGFNQVRNDLTAHYQLGADIDLSGFATGNGWKPIAGSTMTPFSGTFDGQGYTISNMVRTGDFEEMLELEGSLFGYVENSIITNLNLMDVNINLETPYSVGALASVVESSIISQIGVTGNSQVYGYNVAAGLVGEAFDSTFTDVFSEATVSSDNRAGGLFGMGSNVVVSRSYASGAIVTGIESGGLFGMGFENVVLVDSFALNPTVGNEFSMSGPIAPMGTYPGTFALSSMTLLGWGAENNGGGIVTESQAKQQLTYEALGWDFGNTWMIDEGVSYPKLKLAISPPVEGTNMDLVAGYNKVKNNVIISTKRPIKDFDLSTALPYGYSNAN